ncbi:MAG: 3-dehydroquinate synthase [Candidatus Omnitrophica bacterium]|nr:3-dehydroquinate synthase [Candidatus Omnitrophota bacterium]MBU4418770.1 3-dehydroquinate synthase [Candidatus Omnitrophota bacterium]MBU4468268.1 3-dehydroquinate synthase [Candidatus Omnitrophota bacterium]MCG2708573.1 3-dehydroquinate synthase [Candidatus Omnitrophota bacterium]
MHKVSVNLGKRAYNIIIGGGIFYQLGAYLKKIDIGTDAFIISNAFLKNKYGAKLSQVLSGNGFNCYFKLVADSEKSKSIQTASAVIKELAKFDQKRKVFIIAFGGGVVGDLAGFVASVYKRGINYIQVPTTLLAQVDSAIGGKTAVDLDLGKNLVGTFYQPRLVFSEVNFLKSLDITQVRCGMAEVIKYAVINDPKLFNFLENKYQEVIQRNPAALEIIINACSRIKAGIVTQDEKETSGLRSILNFGHTIGHAIEAAGGYKGYNHGQAVSLGMIVAVDLSKKLGLIAAKSAARIKNLIKLYGLPVKIKGVAVAKIIRAHYHDKKFSGKENKFVLIEGIGKPRIVRNIKLDLIKEAVRGVI